VPPESLVTGLPGKVVRPVNDADRERIRRTTEHYIAYARSYRASAPHF
jgi:carbonic anhydrase/acetyltransferase-like protein (isoleucine patch superfamily)